MKKIFIFISIILLTSCNKDYFEFDTVEHFEVAEQFKNQNFDEDFPALIVEDSIPELNEAFEKNIEPFYVFKSNLDSIKKEKIRKIYRSKFISKVSAMEDGQVYRHILIFKKDNIITGVSKICLGCEKDFTVNQFGEVKHIDMTDFDKLDEVLK